MDMDIIPYYDPLMRKNFPESNYAFIGTYDEKALRHFVKKHSNELYGNYAMLLFIDKESYQIDLKEWEAFNNFYEQFKYVGFNLFGVSSICHDDLRNVLQESNLEIKFPIIFVANSQLSQNFGFFRINRKDDNRKEAMRKIHPCKAILTLDDKMNTLHMNMRVEAIVADPKMQLMILIGIKSIEDKLKCENVNINLKLNKLST